MRRAALLCMLLLHAMTFSQNTEQKTILDQFIKAHNAGTDDALASFIKATYHPDVYARIELDKHIAFYQHIVKEFGPLNHMIYKVEKATPLKLSVHLIKKEELITNKRIDPAEILVVNMDLHPEDQQYMAMGLGLGALICERKD